VSDPPVTFSIVSLFLHADIVVKGVLLLLLAASVWSWAVIIEKLGRLAAVRRSTRSCEAKVATAQTATDLTALSGRPDGADPAATVLSAGWSERAPNAERETEGERRERIERAMRIALGAELRRLEARLPFLATLGSAAPFVGLFGTVWGIMRSFSGIAAANNTSLAVVAPGIAEALFATAMGLAAAIPAVVAYNKFTVDLGRFAGHMNGLIGRSSRILARLPAET
jgi:biopolymer transport protein TolQ